MMSKTIQTNVSVIYRSEAEQGTLTVVLKKRVTYSISFLFYSSADLSSEKKETPAIESSSNETDGATRRKSSTDTTAGATSTKFRLKKTGKKRTSKATLSSLVKRDRKTLLNEYAQKMRAKPPVFEQILGSDEGFRTKVIVLGESFESAGSYPSKKGSKQMAAKEAMEYFYGLSSENSSATISAGHSAVSSSLDSTICAVTSVGTVEPGVEQLSAGVEVLKLSSEASVSNSLGRQQMLTSTPKTYPNAKNALQEYVQKKKLDQGVRYESLQDPTTKEHLSKVFVGKRCFKGKQPKAKVKEAEKTCC